MNVEVVLGLEKGRAVETWPSLSFTALPTANSTSYVARVPAEPKNDTMPSIPCFSSPCNYVIHVIPFQWWSTCSCLPVHLNFPCTPFTRHGFVTSAALHVGRLLRIMWPGAFSFWSGSIDVIFQQYLHLSDVDKAQVAPDPLIRWEMWFAASLSRGF